MIEITLKEWQKLPQDKKYVEYINGEFKFYGTTL